MIYQFMIKDFAVCPLVLSYTTQHLKNLKGQRQQKTKLSIQGRKKELWFSNQRRQLIHLWQNLTVNNETSAGKALPKECRVDTLKSEQTTYYYPSD